MNVLQKAREENAVTLKWVSDVSGVSLKTLQNIEALPNKKLSYAHLKLYADALVVPIGSLFDSDCSLPFKRGSAIRAYRILKLLETKEDDAEKLNLIALAKQALENAAPGLKGRKLPPMIPLKHDREKIGKVGEFEIDRAYHDAPPKVLPQII